MAKVEKRRFRNTTEGFLGVSKYKPNGDEHAIALEPNGTVELTEEEIDLTARAPKDPAKNPFLPQPFEVRDPNTDELLEAGTRPPLVEDDEERYVPPRGKNAPGEEVGTPSARKPAARRRRQPAGAAK